MARDLSEARPEAVGLSAAGLDGVDAGLQALIDAGELAGAVTLVARHGRVARRSVLGLDNLERRTPLKADTLFRIYSMTKPVTAVAMMILHDQGLWRPEDPIAKFLPAFADAKVFAGVDAAGAPIVVPAEHAPTMGELMTHTAGLSYGASEEPWDKPYKAAAPWSAASLGEFAARIGRLPLTYQPGRKWLYSLSMDVQGAIVEALSGESLADFMARRIFAPLGMVDTGFYAPPEKAARLATLYRTSRTRSLVALERPPLLGDNLSPPRVPSGGGGLVSTLDDYARFAQMLLDGGEFGGARIISPEAVALMRRNHLPAWMLEAGFGVGAMQIRPGFGYGFNCAVFTDPAKAGLPVGQGTFEWDGAAGTWFWVDPANDLIFVGMIQRFAVTEGYANAQQLTQRLLAAAIVG
ncbi:MAG TPA: serine hydrolase domain-containing protein [Rhizomicrobium sp.]|jgi:CubicO group peptidase (beta-lactamase class C family)|nr:serine hydrolase domain-containing protein [Rhizomicrobium sp.]